MGGDRTRRHHQRPARNSDSARSADPLLAPHRPPAAATISARRPWRVRARRAAVVSRGIAARARVPALRLRARNVRARHHDPLSPDRAVLVLFADRSGRRIPLDRARALRSEALALGLVGAAREPAGAGGDFSGVLGFGTVVVLLAESVEAPAVCPAADACLRSCGSERAGWWNRRGTADLCGDRTAAWDRAPVLDHFASPANQPPARR